MKMKNPPMKKNLKLEHFMLIFWKQLKSLFSLLMDVIFCAPLLLSLGIVFCKLLMLLLDALCSCSFVGIEIIFSYDSRCILIKM
ncbi:hypothetical protein RDI58_007426 [Solanum bulbocastanum]|uniref:Uncharacterized protein n=1 Tax=Solanum bulbocastanum TaxID=147425 RepID=A0AAN8U091_SOLBU